MRPEEFIDIPRRIDEEHHNDRIAYDFFSDHQDRLDEQDRAEDKAGRSWGHLAYRDRPSSAERRAHFDENRVRSLTHPRTGDVQVQPRDCPIDEAA